jgi:hypothetical protein
MLDKTWTAMDVERLKRMYADNYSMSEIGKALGTTRNAVSGKVMRLGLTGTRKAPIKVKKSRRRPRAQTPRPIIAKPQRVMGSQRFTDEVFDTEYSDSSVMLPGSPPLPAIVEIVLPPGAGHLVTLDELGPNDCCAVVGDMPAIYCGQTKGLNWKGARSSYCAEHHALYYAPPSQAYRNRKAYREGVAR